MGWSKSLYNCKKTKKNTQPIRGHNYCQFARSVPIPGVCGESWESCFQPQPVFSLMAKCTVLMCAMQYFMPVSAGHLARKDPNCLEWNEHAVVRWICNQSWQPTRSAQPPCTNIMGFLVQIKLCETSAVSRDLGTPVRADIWALKAWEPFRGGGGSKDMSPGKMLKIRVSQMPFPAFCPEMCFLTFWGVILKFLNVVFEKPSDYST